MKAKLSIFFHKKSPSHCPLQWPGLKPCRTSPRSEADHEVIPKKKDVVGLK